MEVSMKFSGLKTFGFVGFFALVVSCSSTTGTTDEEYEAGSSSRLSSSSIASSSSKTIVPVADSSLVDTSLAAPTGLTATELDGSWILSWNYTDNVKNPAKAFSVQVLDLDVEGEPAWKELSQTIHDVYRYRIGRQASTYLYYRVAALGGDGSRSRYSEEVLVQVNADEVVDESSSSAADPLNAPTGLVATELDGVWLLSWNYENNKKNPVDSFAIEVLDMEVEGVPSWKSFATTAPDVYRFRVGKLSGKYLFYRVAARNASGELSAYSDEVMIQVSDEAVESSSSSAVSPVASPTGLSASQIDGDWILSWNYKDETANPASKFVVQMLDLENASDWKDVAEVSSTVQLYRIGTPRYAYFYYRVAAENAAGERSAYSDKILVNLTQTAVSAPVIGGTEVLSKKKTRLLYWTFASSSVFPVKGFVIDQLDLATNAWKNLGQVDAATLRYEIGLSTEDRHFRVRAYSANEDTLASSAYTVSAETLPAPSGLSAFRVAPSVWQLTWDYSQNALREETGFLVQTSADGNANWTVASKVSAGILYYYASGNGNLEKYFRIAAYDAEDTTNYTSSLQLVANTDEIAYRNDMQPTTPTVAVSVISQKASGFVNGDTVETEFVDTLDYALSINSGFTNKNILLSEYTDTVYYEVRWYTESPNSAVTESIEVDRLATKYSNIEGHLEIPTLKRGTKDEPKSGYTCGDKIQNLYGQLRIVWKDTNDVTDYSEWTDPQKAGRVCAE